MPVSKIHLLLFYCLIASVAVSQPPSKEVIEAMISDADNEKSDTARIRKYLEIDDLIYKYDQMLDEALNTKARLLAEAGLKSERENSSIYKWHEIKLMDIYSNLGGIFRERGNYKEAIKLHQKSLEIAKKYDETAKIARSMNNLGLTYMSLSDFFKAEATFLEAIDYYKKLNNPSKLTTVYGNIGLVYKKMGRFKQSLQYYFKSCELAEKSGNNYILSNNYLVIMNLYYDMRDSLTAFKYLKKAEELAAEIQIPDLQFNIKNELAHYYQNKGNKEMAENLMLEVIDYHESVQNYFFVRSLLTNLALMMNRFSEPEKRKLYLFRAVEIDKKVVEETGETTDRAHLFYHLAHFYKDQGDMLKAYDLCKQAFEMAIESNELQSIMQTSLMLSNFSAEKNLFQDAYAQLKIYMKMRDSLLNDETRNSIMSLEARMEYQHKLEKDSLLNVEKDITIARQDAEAEKSKTQRVALMGGIGLIALFSIFLFNRYRLISKQKKLITSQKTEVERQRIEANHQRDLVQEKNREIIDSINYAKHIQQAILPSRESLIKNLKNGFLLYKPKDIVAGDFYWLESFEDKILVAVADCTGHGVPGAMVSVICSNALTKAVQEERITNPGLLLDRTRELVIQRFSKSGEEVKDGMDISLVSLPVLESTTLSIEWAGANNPLWIIRKGSQTVEEIKPDKQPIGKYAGESPFTTHQLKMQSGDTFYLFTDGYQDQFGGDNTISSGGKKFKAANLKRLLLSVQSEDMDRQKEILETEFENWRGDIEQIDDVCIIGVRI